MIPQTLTSSVLEPPRVTPPVTSKFSEPKDPYPTPYEPAPYPVPSLTYLHLYAPDTCAWRERFHNGWLVKSESIYSAKVTPLYDGDSI